MQLKIKKVNPEAKLPQFATVGDGGMDLFTAEEITLAPGQKIGIPTGIAIEIPHGYVGLIWDKSGIAINHGLKTLGGVIDSGFRGEVKVGIVNVSQEPYTFAKGHKVAQMLIQKVEHPELIEATSLSESDRGANGFGSTGK